MALTSVSPTARSSDLPTSVEPVNAILSTPGCRAKAVADDGAGTGDHVEDAVRQTRLARELGEPQGGQRRLRCGLQDDRVAGRQRGAQLPGGDDQRVVPGHDRGHDADRLARHQRERAGPGRADLAVDLVDRLGVPLEGGRRRRDVDRERVPDRLADVERLEQGELLEVCRGSARPARRSTRLRSAGERSDQRPSSKARRAAATARSTSSAPPSATWAMTEPSRPAMSSNVLPGRGRHERARR